MNKALLTAVLSAATLVSSAQIVEVQSIQKVPMQLDIPVNISRISPDGTFAIVSSLNDNTLSRIDFATGAVSTVADNGSALQLVFTPEGTNIVYKNASTDQATHRRYYSVETADLATGRVRTLAQPARHSASYTMAPSGTLSINAQGRFKALSVRDQAVPADPMAIVDINHGHLEVTLADGTSRFIDPQGKGSYLWPSLSPDGTKILYYLSMHGCYVCNLDGSNPQPLGYIHAPHWMGNDLVLGQQDFDNGVTLTQSAIVVSTLAGQMQTIVPAEMKALNPSASADGKTVTFSTDMGELYIVTLK